MRGKKAIAARTLRGACRSGAAVFAALSILASGVAAQTPELDERQRKALEKIPNPANGLAVAQKLCTSCHRIGSSADGATAADVPPFPAIANSPGQSMERLTAWLTKPHAPMPDLNLSQKEIRDLSAFVMSLRQRP